MVKINWTPQSKNDLIAIADFIAQNSVKYARIQVQRIRERVRQLATFPNSGRIVPELNIPRIREVILGNYRIIYITATDERIDILTIHHSAKLLDI
ncbi:addiction module toxin, RelE/StbE family [Reichenbachiella agariperforans]|uniref:Addiction module toxin, RelE/StbE family n=1 Tax=Reichenbachiella agariperforans TaxID=156994 RepID=A0A1M6LRV1_REIAG|nr:addiction module toxin, RelE/StbE family [Reichenbachiella agariperforans]